MDRLRRPVVVLLAILLLATATAPVAGAGEPALLAATAVTFNVARLPLNPSPPASDGS